jgi:hypothetical protein
MRGKEEYLDPGMIDSKYGHTVIQPSFSHWTVAYALSLNGKLLY